MAEVVSQNLEAGRAASSASSANLIKELGAYGLGVWGFKAGGLGV